MSLSSSLSSSLSIFEVDDNNTDGDLPSPSPSFIVAATRLEEDDDGDDNNDDVVCGSNDDGGILWAVDGCDEVVEGVGDDCVIV